MGNAEDLCKLRLCQLFLSIHLWLSRKMAREIINIQVSWSWSLKIAISWSNRLVRLGRTGKINTFHASLQNSKTTVILRDPLGWKPGRLSSHRRFMLIDATWFLRLVKHSGEPSWPNMVLIIKEWATTVENPLNGILILRQFYHGTDPLQLERVMNQSVLFSDINPLTRPFWSQTGVYFDQVEARGDSDIKYVPRSIQVDLEPGVLNRVSCLCKFILYRPHNLGARSTKVDR